MSDIAMSAAVVRSQPTETRASQFLMRRGVLLMKEFREFGTLKGTYGEKMAVKTLVLTVARSTTNPEETSFSIKLEYAKGNTEGAALIDFDEIEEIQRAISFIEKSAHKIKGQKRDYTELIYSTKDNLQFGFYHDTLANQLFFIKFDSRNLMFCESSEIPRLKELLADAGEHLQSKGAGK